MNILIIDSGIIVHKSLINIPIYTTGFRNQNSIKDVQDVTGHGTAVAGLITKGHINICLYILKVFDEDYQCEIEDLIEALEYVYNNNDYYDIINMSFGITAYDSPHQLGRLKTACQKLADKGMLLISAYDNEGAISYPAFFDCVIGVDSSDKARNKTEYEYIENASINLRAYGSTQKVLWSNPPYTIISGNSFACANMTNRMIEFLRSEGCLIDKIRNNAMFVYQIDKSAPVQQAPKWLKGSKSILLPFNKEMHSLLAFESELVFKVVDVYDWKYRANIGESISQKIDYHNVINRIIKNYDKINWDSDDFDTVIAGHMSELSWLCKRDLLEEIVERCCQSKKNLYTFDDLSPYISLIQKNKVDIKRFFYPHIYSQNIPKGHFGKMHDIITPVLAVIGTSSQQGKFTLQLSMRERLQKMGYHVGQIGSEPSAYCFNMNYSFPYGYQSSVKTDGYENILLLNQLMHNIDQQNVDICLVGTQSNTVAYCNNNLSMIPLHQYEFLLGTNPDAFVLVVNPHDEIPYILRTLNAIEGAIDCKCISVVVFPIEKHSMLGDLYRNVNVLENKNYLIFKKSVEQAVQVPVLDMDEAMHTEKLTDFVIDFFGSEDNG